MHFLFIWLAIVCLLALGLLWTLSFPEQRDACYRKLKTHLANIAQRLYQLGRRGEQRLNQQTASGRDTLTGSARHLWQKRYTIITIAVILTLPSVLILTLRDRVELQGYNSSNTLNDSTAQLITALLRGKQLVPPPALPPDVFVTQEVEHQKPQLKLGQANRDWNLLNPQFRQRLLAVFKVMREQYGYHMVMIEGYRSPQRQAMLAAKGGNVTNAKAGQSYHQYGMAADCAFYRDGKLVISAKSQWAMRGYELYGKVAKEADLVWGGSWKSIRDLGHVEIHLPGKGPHAD